MEEVPLKSSISRKVASRKPRFPGYMNKKGQTSIFIILGILVAIVILFIFFNANPNLESFSLTSFSKQTQQVDGGIRDCFEDIYKESIDELGLQGGYYNEPLSEYILNDIYTIPFYYFGELVYIPSKELMEDQISANIHSKKQRCFNLFETSDLDYEYYYNYTKVAIKENSIEFNNNLVLTLSKAESTTVIDFSNPTKGIKSNLYAMNNLASYIALSYNINEESLCISCFQEIALKEKLFVEIDETLENILVVNIIETKDNSYPLDYNFALSATKETPSINIPSFENESPSNTQKSQLNFNIANFQDE